MDGARNTVNSSMILVSSVDRRFLTRQAYTHAVKLALPAEDICTKDPVRGARQYFVVCHQVRGIVTQSSTPNRGNSTGHSGGTTCARPAQLLGCWSELQTNVVEAKQREILHDFIPYAHLYPLPSFLSWNTWPVFQTHAGT